MAEVESFMEQFKSEDIELIWGLSQDMNLENGEVKVTVLATGFGMKDIPDMRPMIQKEEEEQLILSREEIEQREREERQLDSMVEALYKPDFKVYIFRGEDMYNEELLTALDNSPTYSRTAQELERIASIATAVRPKEEIPNNVTEENVEQQENI
jgi:cell division protein FtsZ